MFYFFSGRQATQSFIRRYECRICRGGPQGLPPLSPDLIILEVFFCGYRKALVYQEKSEEKDELMRWVMDAAARIWKTVTSVL